MTKKVILSQIKEVENMNEEKPLMIVREGKMLIYIAGVPRECSIERRPLDSLYLDLDNVRFKHEKKPMSDKEMEDIIWNEDDTRQLYNAVRQAGGLTNPLVILEDGKVKEGNRRLVVLRKIKPEIKSGKKTKWDTNLESIENVPCVVLPSGLTKLETDIYLGREHVTGKKEWKAINRGWYIFNLHDEDNRTFDDIRDDLGIPKGEVLKKYTAYKWTKEYLEKFPNKGKITDFSFFEELYKKKELRDMMNGENQNLKWTLEDVMGWVAEGRFDDAGSRDIRILPKILSNPEARDAFIKDGFGIKAAKLQLVLSDPSLSFNVLKQVKRTIIELRDMKISELELLLKPQGKGLLMELKGEIDKKLGEAKRLRG